MTERSRLLRSHWSWSTAFFMGAVVVGVSLLEAQEPDNGPIKMKETALVKVHELRGVNPQIVLDVLQKHFEEHDDLNLALDAQSNRIIARATTADHKSIQEVIKQLAPPNAADPVAVKADQQNALNWEPFIASRAQQLISEGKTVMVYFTADWSMNGKRNLEVAIHTQKVRERIQAKGVVPMIADLTKHPSELWDWLKDSRMGESIPLLVFHGPKQLEQPIVLRDLVTEADVLKALEDTGASQSKADPTFGAGDMGNAMSRSVITWTKPQGEKPDWLIRGENAVRAREKTRQKLDVSKEFEFHSQPLATVLVYLADTYELPIYINAKSLEEQQVTPEEPITITATGSLRSVLPRILHPLSLDYIVLEDGLEVVQGADAIRQGAVCSYNLAHVTYNPSDATSIVNTIERMVQPDQWDTNGGQATCVLMGSVLLVKASEGMNEEVRNLLAQLNAMQPEEEKPQ
jgi:hypothetical protein